MVIDKLKQDLQGAHSDSALKYFYFDQQKKDCLSPALVIANLAKQLVSQKLVPPRAILDVFETKGTSEKPDPQTAEELFITACSGYTQNYVVLDALDECEEKSHRKTFLQFLNKSRKRTDVRIFVTSRFYPMDIQMTLSEAIKLEVVAHNSDIEQYLSQRIEGDPMADEVDGDFKNRIIETIVSNARGL